MGKVRPNFSGVEHRGSAAWPILPKHLRGVITENGKPTKGSGTPRTTAKATPVKKSRRRAR